MAPRSGAAARVVAFAYAACVLITTALSLSPATHSNGELLALILSLPWGLAVRLALDTLDPSLVVNLGPPLVALAGFLNAYLLFNALSGKGR